jgi:uridine kinase
MFNSAMLFEIAVIKDMVDPILAEVPENCPEYTKARQLRDFLKLFHTIPSQNLPPTSLVREFIGGSSFDY